MSNRTDTELLYDIQEALRRIKAYTHEMTYKIVELPDLALQIAKISVNNSTTNDES